MRLETKAGFAILAAVTLLLWEVGRADAAAIVWGRRILSLATQT
jgi:hypothetical protein